MAKIYAVIMAGGRGERFWPLSTAQVPKPFIPLLGSTTIIQDTVARLQPLIPVDRILISIGESHREISHQQLPEIPPENFIVEPVGRDTSACLGYCALHLERRDPDSIMLALPADHYVRDPAAFRNSIKKGIGQLETATAVVFGIVPVRPDTGYGYIHARKPEESSDSWPVIRFVEKPTIEIAEQYVKSKDYFWNSGIFLWENRTLLRLFELHMPDTYRRLKKLQPLMGKSDGQAERLRIFSTLKRISIDYGILEKTTGLRLVPVDFGWDDIGNWASLERVLPSDLRHSISRGSFVALDSRGCISYSDAGPVAAFGVYDLIIVQAHGKVLVCAKDRAGDLKRLVAALNADDR